MKKITKYLNFLAVTLLTMITTYQFRVKADSGFDGGYDGGGDFGGGYDGGSSYSSSGDGEFDLVTFVYIIFSLAYLVAYIYLRDTIFKKENKASKIWKFLFWIFALIINNIFVYFIFGKITMYINLLIIIIFKIYIEFEDCSIGHKKKKEVKIVTNKLTDDEIYKKLGNDFDINNFYNQIFNNYKDIQIAWMNNTLEDIRGLLTDEMFNMYKMQLMTLTTKKQKNMMEDITYIDAYIIDIRQNNGKEAIDVCLTVTCRDYIINTVNNKVVRGNKNYIVEYVYKLSFIRNKTLSTLNNCPACGAKIPNQMSTKCEYCNSVIIKESDNYILTEKKVIRQTNRRG